MGIYDQRRICLDCIVLLAKLYSIVLIVSYWMGCIVSNGLYSIDCIVAGNTGFYALAGYWMYGTDRTDEPDGTLMGQGWDGWTDVSRRRNGSATIGS